MDMIVLTNWRLSVNVKWNNKFEKFADTRDSLTVAIFASWNSHSSSYERGEEFPSTLTTTRTLRFILTAGYCFMADTLGLFVEAVVNNRGNGLLVQLHVLGKMSYVLSVITGSAPGGGADSLRYNIEFEILIVL